MTTTAAGGRITGLLALTMATDVALAEGDFAMIVGDYKVGLCDGTKRPLGQVSVRSVKRVVTDTASTFPVATTTGGQVTVEARGLYVSECVAGGTITAGDHVVINNAGALVSQGAVTYSVAFAGIALTGATIGNKFDLLVP